MINDAGGSRIRGSPFSNFYTSRINKYERDHSDTKSTRVPLDIAYIVRGTVQMDTERRSSYVGGWGETHSNLRLQF